MSEEIAKAELRTIREIIGQDIGEASICWSELPNGIFDSTKASFIVDRLALKYESLDADNAALRKELKELKDKRRKGICEVCWEEGCQSVCGQDFNESRFKIDALKSAIKSAIEAWELELVRYKMLVSSSSEYLGKTIPESKMEQALSLLREVIK